MEDPLADLEYLDMGRLRRLRLTERESEVVAFVARTHSFALEFSDNEARALTSEIEARCFHADLEVGSSALCLGAGPSIPPPLRLT
eukprot:3801700-Alexandrium_andersonii.AAC.1